VGSVASQAERGEKHEKKTAATNIQHHIHPYHLILAMSSPPQHVFFYSNYCTHSKELLMTITKLDLRSLFVFVCVEKYPRSMIPASIDRVPTIVSPDHDIICDNRIVDYVHGLKVSQKKSGSSNDNSVKALSPPPSSSSASSSSSAPLEVAFDALFSSTNAGFSYIGREEGGGQGQESDEVRDGASGIASSYGIFGMEQRIETPNEDDDGDDDATADYERYKASRDADLNALVKG
jgi:hypothetical protein